MITKNEINTEISERISILIDFLSISPNKFAKILGYERGQTIYDIKNGVSAPSFDFFKRLFSSEYSVLINPIWLFTGKGSIGDNANHNEKSIPDYIEVIKKQELPPGKKLSYTALESIIKEKEKALQNAESEIESRKEINKLKDEKITNLELKLSELENVRDGQKRKTA